MTKQLRSFRPSTFTVAPRLFRSASRLALMVAVAMPAALPAPVHAQEGPLEEIVVSARFREERLQTTPLAISAISAEELNVRDFVDITDLGKTVPNAFMQPSGSAFGQGSSISIRGVSQGDYAFSGEPRNAIYVDDVYYGTVFGSVYDLLDLDRVEVLRGPQGTLFGRNAMGGAIRMVSKKPEGGGSGEIRALYGSYDRLELRGSYDHTLVEDKLFLRVAGMSRHRKGYQKALDFTCDMIAKGTPELAGIGDGVARLRDPGDNGILEATDPFLPDLPTSDPYGLASGRQVGTAATYQELFGIDVTADPTSAATFSADDDLLSFPMRTRDARRGGDECVFDRYGSQDVQGARVMLRYVASDALEINLSGFYSDNNSSAAADSLIDVGGSDGMGGIISNPEPGSPIGLGELAGWNQAVNIPRWGIPYDSRFVTGDPYTTYGTYDDLALGRSYTRKSTAEVWGVAGTADLALNDKTQARLILQYQARNGEFTHDADQSPLVIQHNWNFIESKEWSAELRFSGLALGDNLEWTVGGIHWAADQYNGGDVNIDNLVLVGALPFFTTNDSADNQSQGLYGHLVYQLTERLSASGGLRYTRDKKTFHFDHYFSVSVPANGESLDWKASLDYQATDSLFVYAQVATGYTATTFNARPFTPEQLIAFPEEQLISYEAGAKADLFNRRLRLNTAVFYSDYDPRILGAQSQLDENGIPNVTPVVATSQLWGVEAELSASPIDGLSIDATLGYLHLSAADIEGGTAGAGLPPWQFSAGAQYEFALGGNSGSLTPRIDWYWTDGIGFGFDPNTVRGSFQTVNARLAYDTPNRDWSLALMVTNLFDEFYWLNQFDRRSRNGGSLEGQPSRPREWSIAVSRYF